MSLLSQGNTRAVVYQREVVGTDYGEELVEADGIHVGRLTVQPVTSREENPGADIKIIGRGQWPGDVHALIHITGGHYAGEWEQVGATLYHATSPRTSHYVVLATSRAVHVRRKDGDNGS